MAHIAPPKLPISIEYGCFGYPKLPTHPFRGVGDWGVRNGGPDYPHLRTAIQGGMRHPTLSPGGQGVAPRNIEGTPSGGTPRVNSASLPRYFQNIA